MELTSKWWYIVLVVVIIFPTAAQKVSELSFGDLFWGPDIGDTKYLKGRIVLIKCWSTETVGSGDMALEHAYQKKADSGSAYSADNYIPALIKLYEKYKHRGLVVISVHFRMSKLPESSVKSKLWKYAVHHQIPFPVYLGCGGNTTPPYVPYIFLFDTQGKLVFKSPAVNGLKDTEELLNKSPYWLLNEKKISSSLVPIANEIARGYNLGKVYINLQKIVEKSEGEKKTDAEYLRDCIQNYMEQEKSKMDHLKLTDPYFCLDSYKSFLQVFGGHPDIRETEKEYSAFKKNRNLWDAHKIFSQFQNTYYELNPVKYGESLDLSNHQCYQKNADKIRRLVEYGNALKTKYSDTPYWKKAEPLYEEALASIK